MSILRALRLFPALMAAGPALTAAGIAVAAAAFTALPIPARASVVETSAGPLQIDRVATGLNEPWALAFLPDGRFLVTERDGRLTLYPAEGGTPLAALAGLPDVAAIGQGGLLDVMVPRDFAQTREIWLSFSQPQGEAGGAGTAVGKGTLSQDSRRIEGFTTLFAAAPGPTGGKHFGARLVEGRSGTIYLTTGERGLGDPAQDPMRAEGKVIALARDGQPASHLSGFLAGVFSLGHRNPQGAALDADGRLWLVEHGAQGGDELNHIDEGRNYGWPVIAYGEEYGGGQIGEGRVKAGMEQPVTYWDPSIAPSGLMIHSGRLLPGWQGDFFTGSLKFDYIARLDPEAGYGEERISAPETIRVRDVREAPDGAIWFLSVGNGAVYRMAPRP